MDNPKFENSKECPATDVNGNACPSPNSELNKPVPEVPLDDVDLSNANVIIADPVLDDLHININVEKFRAFDEVSKVLDDHVDEVLARMQAEQNANGGADAGEIKKDESGAAGPTKSNDLILFEEPAQLSTIEKSISENFLQDAGAGAVNPLDADNVLSINDNIKSSVSIDSNSSVDSTTKEELVMSLLKKIAIANKIEVISQESFYNTSSNFQFDMVPCPTGQNEPSVQVKKSGVVYKPTKKKVQSDSMTNLLLLKSEKDFQKTYPTNGINTLEKTNSLGRRVTLGIRTAFQSCFSSNDAKHEFQTQSEEEEEELSKSNSRVQATPRDSIEVALSRRAEPMEPNGEKPEKRRAWKTLPRKFKFWKH